MGDKLCTVDKCNRKHAAKGYCPTHYYQDRRTGQTTSISTPRRYDGADCVFKSCRLKARSNGLCEGHESQQRKGKTLAPLKRRNLGRQLDEQGRKLCQGCDEWKPADTTYFGLAKWAQDGIEPRCRRCRKNSRLLSVYNIGIDYYDHMYEAQGGTCAISTCDETQGRDGRELHIDHDHRCCSGSKSCGKCVRGLLCHAHNSVLGFIHDQEEDCDALKRYLASHRKREEWYNRECN